MAWNRYVSCVTTPITRPERRQLDPPDVDAVDLDGARVDVVQPRDQVGRGRLARSGRPHERDELTGRGLEVDVLELELRDDLDRRHGQRPVPVAVHGIDDGRQAAGIDRRGRQRGLELPASATASPSWSCPRATASIARADGTASVGYWKDDVVEADPTADRGRVEGHRVGRVDDLGIHLEVLEDPVEERQGPLDLDLDVQQLAEREEQAALERGEGHDVADRRGRRVALDRQPAGQPVHERRRDAEDRADDHEEPAPDHRLADLERGQLRVASRRNRRFDASCCPNVFDSRMPRR